MGDLFSALELNIVYYYIVINLLLLHKQATDIATG